MGRTESDTKNRFSLISRLVFAALALTSIYIIGYRLGIPEHYRFILTGSSLPSLISNLALDLVSLTLFVSVGAAFAIREKAMFANIAQFKHLAISRLRLWWGLETPSIDEDEVPGDLGEIAFSQEKEADRAQATPVFFLFNWTAFALFLYWHTGFGFLSPIPAACTIIIVALYFGSRISWRSFMLSIQQKDNKNPRWIIELFDSLPETSIPIIMLIFFALGNAKENSTLNYGDIVLDGAVISDSTVVIARESIWLVRDAEGDYQLVSTAYASNP